MKEILLALACLLFVTSSVFAQTTYRVNEKRSFAWDYNLTENPTVVRFEVQIDTTGWVSAGIAMIYAIPTLAVGDHMVSVRACNSTECGEATSLSFRITPLLPPTPTRPRLELVPSPPVTTGQSSSMAQSYSYLWNLKRLDRKEMRELNDAYDGPHPPTYDSVFDFLERYFLLIDVATITK